MSDINIAFCRGLLKLAVAALTPEQRAHYRRNSGVTGRRGDYYCFEWMQNGVRFVWEGKADNAYDARYHGLCSWLAKHGNDAQRKEYA